MVGRVEDYKYLAILCFGSALEACKDSLSLNTNTENAVSPTKTGHQDPGRFGGQPCWQVWDIRLTSRERAGRTHSQRSNTTGSYTAS